MRYCVFTAVFASGARDGAIMIWDIRANHSQGQPRPDNSIFDAHGLKVPHGIKHRKTASQLSKSSTSTSVTALAFQDDYTLFSCSAGDGYEKFLTCMCTSRKSYSLNYAFLKFFPV